MPTHEMARYAYPIIEVVGDENVPTRDKRSRTSTLRLSLCEPNEPQTEAITRWRRPTTVVESVELPEKLDPNLVLLTAPEQPAATSYRLLRHRLLSNGDPRVIAVTSPSDGDGKSTCALNLALALGEDVGARVALIEANLRRPSLAKSLGFTPSHCFAEQMSNLDSTTRPWVMTKLDGRRVELASVDPSAPERPKLDRVLLAAALKDLREEYNYIIVDTPAVLDSADVNLISETVDGVVMVARAKKTRRAALRAAVEQLAPARILGVVLLDSTAKEVS
ncbi:MAG TPA: CpsD/CapB family tyrosine-protein kinase [Polyangiaceae bacterium]|nr:CpsD/CapB family tyrosine-protein kinase [Polyangiaceae bacterium]